MSWMLGKTSRSWMAKGWLAAVLSAGTMAALGAAGAGGAGVVALNTTQIADTVLKADGTAAAGTVVVSWPAFATATGAGVPAGTTSVTLGAGGALSLRLVPNAGSTPIGSYYTVVYHLSDGTSTKEYWVVPSQVGAVKLAAIRSTVLPTSVAMQTVSKSYVDTAIAAAVAGRPLDSSPYVVKAGDTMQGPLILAEDPQSPMEASDKQYVDAQVAAVGGGLGQKVSTLPSATQVVTQPTGTDLEVNRLNGTLYAKQYASGQGNNGVANATASADCANGCDVKAEQTYGAGEVVQPLNWAGGTQLEDRRGGADYRTFLNPQSPEAPGQGAGVSVDVVSTASTQAVHAATGANNIFSTGVVVTNNSLTGGSNTFPQLVQGNVPYFKTTYSAMNLTGNSNTQGQHVLVPEQQNCYGVGDCIMNGYYMNTSGGFRDDADEAAHPFELQFMEDSRTFEGVCAQGCAAGATTLPVTPTANGGTQGEGRYLLEMNPAKVLTGGTLVGGTPTGGRQPQATFTGTNFAVSTLLETAQTITSQANDVQPGTVNVALVTSGVPTGFATNTAALSAATGVACVTDTAVADGRPLNYETAAYTVVDGSHLRMTLHRPHATGATVAVGGLCGYGLEQTVDTVNGIRQVFPVVASTSATTVLYAGGQSALIGVQGLQSAYANVNLLVASIARANNVVTVTTAGNLPADLNGLTLRVQGVSDASYNGSFAVTTTGPNTLTYAQSGANSTSAGGTVAYVTGGYALYPMAEVLGVYNASTKAVDGQMTLAANTVNWAPGDAVEQPHYFQQAVSADVEAITQYMPRPSRNQGAGILLSGNSGPGLRGWQILNGAPASGYYGNGGTHTAPSIGLEIGGVWRHAAEMQAGEDAAIEVHCNSHGCDKWNSAYDLFQMDTSAGVDRMNYQPATSALNFYLRGTGYGFTPQAFTAGTINVSTLNANSINGNYTGVLAPSNLPVFGAAGTGHSAGAVPDPGPSTGNTRFLREDGVFAAVPASGSTNSVPVSTASTALANLPQRANLLGEYLLTEGAGTTAHDTSGKGNDGTINLNNGGVAWEGVAGAAQDLNFQTTGGYVQLPTAVNAAKAWQIALYAPPLGYEVAPHAPGYGQANGPFTALLCGTDTSHLCLISTSLYKPHVFRFLAQGTDSTEAGEAMTPGWHVLTYLCGSNVNNVVTKTRILYDGVEVGSYINQGDANTCGNPSGGNYQLGGSSQYSGVWFMGKIAAAWAWNNVMSTTDGVVAAKSALDYLKAKGVQTEFRKTVSQTPQILAGLDSRTYGQGLPNVSQAWLYQMQLTDGSYARVNMGVPGETTFDACAMWDLTYGAHLGAGGGSTIAMLWGGVNDYFHLSARQTADQLHCMVTKAKTAGAKVVLATEIAAFGPSSNGGDPNKNALNAILRAEALGWGVDNLADLATDAHIGADGASADSSCFPDAVHPGQNCEPYVTAIMQNAVNELLGSSVTSRHQTAAASYQEVAGDRYLDLTGTSAQTVTLPDCTGYSLPREVVNLGAAGATVTTANGQTLTGTGAVVAGGKGIFLPVPLAQASAGCRWSRE